MFILTIYSPVDNEQHIFNTETPLLVAEKLTNSMESGAWFKIEKE